MYFSRRMVVVFCFALISSSAHAFLGFGSSDDADEVSGADGDLLAATRKGDVEKMESALQAGANPNIKLCSLPTPQTRYGVLGNARCKGAFNSATLFTVIASRCYPQQPPLVEVLAKHGWKWDESVNPLSYFSGSTRLCHKGMDLVGYVPEKLAVIQAIVNSGAYTFTGKDIENITRWSYCRGSGKAEEEVDSVVLAKRFAEFAGLQSYYEAGRQEARINCSNPATSKEDRAETVQEANRKQRDAELAAKAVREAALEEAKRNLPIVRTIGQKICKVTPGTHQEAIGTAMGRTVWGKGTLVDYQLTAFTEGVSSSKIQLRIAGIQYSDARTGRKENMDRLNGDVALAVNSVIWDDPMLWRPCD